MSLSKHLQSPQILQTLPGKNPEDVRALFLEKGMAWYAKHPEESELICANLESFNLPHEPNLIEAIKEHIILHYFEKVYAFCGDTRFFYEFIQERIDVKEAVAQLQDFIGSGKGVLLAVPHFGAVEFVVPSISAHKLPINCVLRFTTDNFSKQVHTYAQTMEQSGLFGPLGIIEIGKPKTMAALDMAAALRRKEILLSVFDEETEYSRPVTLFNRKVSGGAGLDKLIKHTRRSVSTVNAFMVRTDSNHYQLKLFAIDGDEADPIQKMYQNLEKVLKDHLEQWYFLHETIPFID